MRPMLGAVLVATVVRERGRGTERAAVGAAAFSTDPDDIF